MDLYTSYDRDSARKPGQRSVPDALAGLMDGGRIKTLDVRPVLAAGQEPFPIIASAADGLESGWALKLQVPFEPVPLYAVLGRKGFLHWARQREEDGDVLWEVFFYREIEANESDDPGFPGDEIEIDDEPPFEIDVRGLEPPEPLERVLAASEALVYGNVMRVLHHREPLLLFDILAERGFQYRSRQVDNDKWEIRIWRKN